MLLSSLLPSTHLPLPTELHHLSYLQVIICDPNTAGSCGTATTTACQAIQGVGVCTWTD